MKHASQLDPQKFVVEANIVRAINTNFKCDIGGELFNFEEEQIYEFDSITNFIAAIPSDFSLKTELTNLPKEKNYREIFIVTNEWLESNTLYNNKETYKPENRLQREWGFIYVSEAGEGIFN